MLIDLPSSYAAPKGKIMTSKHPVEDQFVLPYGLHAAQGLEALHGRILPLLQQELEDISHCEDICQPRNLSTKQNEEPGFSQFAENLAAIIAISTEHTVQVLRHGQSYGIEDLWARRIKNEYDCWATIKVNGHEYYIPPKSEFCLCQFDGRLLYGADPFHLLLIDAPWPNKSAKRSGVYHQIDIYDLFKIPVRQLLAPHGLVAVWVTNRRKIWDFVVEKLFPSWKVHLVSTWIWLKITTKAKPVFRLDEPSRKPYELLLIACDTDLHMSDTRVFSAVPDFHSRKPCLKAYFEEYMPSDYRACELFARAVIPGWTCMGNEVIKYSWEGYYSDA